MKREALPLLRAARRGEAWALLELGRGYLLGTPPFSPHPQTGLRYLTQAAQAGHPGAPRVLAQCASIEQLVQHGLLRVLRAAAVQGCPEAQLKLGVWLTTDAATRAEGIDCLRRAHAAGQSQARLALANVLIEQSLPQSRDEALRLLRAEALSGNTEAWLPLSRAALAGGESPLFRHAVLRACEQARGDDPDLAILIVRLLTQCSPDALPDEAVPPPRLRALLESAVRQGDARAMLLLGRALAGLDEPLRRRAALPLTGKLGAALLWLQRAADSGADEAWLALADVYEQHPRLSFSAGLRRRYLERGAAAGLPRARARLGRLLLATATGPTDLHEAMQLLHPLARQGDPEVQKLLCSLVLHVVADDGAIGPALAALTARNALLATRLSLARAFGLTRHEALTLDVVTACRSWGLWVDPGVFFSQRRKRQPRAVPAVDVDAEAAMARARVVFRGIDAGPAGPEGDYRHRVYTLNVALLRLRLPASSFFADAPVRDLDALRGGHRWLKFVARLADERAEAALGQLPVSPASPTQIKRRRRASVEAQQMTHS